MLPIDSTIHETAAVIQFARRLLAEIKYHSYHSRETLRRGKQATCFTTPLRLGRKSAFRDRVAKHGPTTAERSFNGFSTVNDNTATTAVAPTDERLTKQDEEERRTRKEKEQEAWDIISKIHAISERDDIELYHQGLKNELQQAEYLDNKWKAVLTARLTPALKDLVADLCKNQDIYDAQGTAILGWEKHPHNPRLERNTPNLDVH